MGGIPVFLPVVLQDLATMYIAVQDRSALPCSLLSCLRELAAGLAAGVIPNEAGGKLGEGKAFDSMCIQYRLASGPSTVPAARSQVTRLP